MGSSSLTSDMVLLKDSLLIALGLGTVVSVMCVNLASVDCVFPGFHSLCFQVGEPRGSLVPDEGAGVRWQLCCFYP